MWKDLGTCRHGCLEKLQNLREVLVNGGVTQGHWLTEGHQGGDEEQHPENAVTEGCAISPHRAVLAVRLCQLVGCSQRTDKHTN